MHEVKNHLKQVEARQSGHPHPLRDTPPRTSTHLPSHVGHVRTRLPGAGGLLKSTCVTDPVPSCVPGHDAIASRHI